MGATEQVLLTAVRAIGRTTLRGAAIEPEIMDLIAILQKMGAIISVQTDRVILIEGVDRLGGFDHLAIPDRIEAGSWACAALATRGDIYVRGAQQLPMMPFLNVFRRIGGKFEIDDDGIRFWHPGGTLNSIAIETDVHPGFMTDWQQPLVVALTQTTGLSIVHETVYENRLGFTDALVEAGAHIQTFRECLGGSPCRFGRANYQHSAAPRCTGSTSSTAGTSASPKSSTTSGPSTSSPDDPIRAAQSGATASVDVLAGPDPGDPHPGRRSPTLVEFDAHPLAHPQVAQPAALRGVRWQVDLHAVVEQGRAGAVVGDAVDGGLHTVNRSASQCPGAVWAEPEPGGLREGPGVVDVDPQSW